jgi:tRNA (mo5U34)-methyltransferase
VFLVSHPLTAEELRSQVAAVPFWWHSLDLGNGVVTRGCKTPRVLQDELAYCHLPDLCGRTVLDIGAWDGFFSFQAERLGAARVVALDHYVWSIDFSQPHPSSQLPEHVPSVRHPDDLPGKRGFDLAHRVLGSRVEPTVADFMEVDLTTLGQFDVVLYLGVLYHMRHPLLALERLAKVTRDLAVIETDAFCIPGLEDRAFCQFFETDELAGDPTNWWSPNAQAVIGMCRAAGFRKVQIQSHPRPARFRRLKMLRRRLQSLLRLSPRKDAGIYHYRLVAHAYK